MRWARPFLSPRLAGQIMPDSEVTIKAAFLNADDVPVSFADVSADD